MNDKLTKGNEMKTKERKENLIERLNEVILQVDELNQEVNAILYESDTELGTNILPHFDAYGAYGFTQLIGNGGPYDGSLPKLVEEIEEVEED